MNAKRKDFEDWIKKECQTSEGPYLRPFSPNSKWHNAEIFIIGINPATPIGIEACGSFSKYWASLTSDNQAYEKFYLKARRGKQESRTTARLKILINAMDNVNFLVTNVCWRPTGRKERLRSNDFKKGEERLKKLIQFVEPKIIFVHGKCAIDTLSNLGYSNIPSPYVEPKTQAKSGEKPLILTYHHLTGAGLKAKTKFRPETDLKIFAEIIKTHLLKLKGRATPPNNNLKQTLKPPSGDIEFQGLKFTQISRDEFLESWEQSYSDPLEELYEKNINKRKTKEVIDQLFQWKNGVRLSGSKRELVRRDFYKFSEEKNVKKIPRKLEPDLETYLSERATIWRIFWLHCQSPTQYPIYDQHVHRAMRYLEGYRNEDVEIPGSNKRKAEFYIKEFLPFVQKNFGSPTNWWEMRRIDKALFAFGKFLKTPVSKELYKAVQSISIGKTRKEVEGDWKDRRICAIKNKKNPFKPNSLRYHRLELLKKQKKKITIREFLEICDENELAKGKARATRKYFEEAQKKTLIEISD